MGTVPFVSLDKEKKSDDSMILKFLDHTCFPRQFKYDRTDYWILGIRPKSLNLGDNENMTRLKTLTVQVTYILRSSLSYVGEVGKLE